MGDGASRCRHCRNFCRARWPNGLWAGAVVAWGTGLLLVFGRYFGGALAYLTDAIAFGLMALGYASYRRAKRHLAAPALDIRRQDNRPPVLLLRSFGDDVIPVQEFRLSFFIQRAQTFEEILTQHLWDYGPVIAIGRPGEAIPPLGAAREYLRNESWQSRLKELSASARMLVLVLGRTEGVLWEIRRVISAGLLSKTVFVLPPVKEEELRDRTKKFAGEVGDEQLFELAPTSEILLFFFPEGAEPLCLTGKSRQAPYYREAMDIAAAAATATSPPTERS
jgi:hypothetical protein